MNHNHLIVKCITLLYYESQTDNPASTVVPIVESAISLIKLPEVTTGLDNEREMLKNLVHTVQKLLVHMDEPIILESLLQQVYIDCMSDPTIRDAIAAGINTKLEEDVIKRLTFGIMKELREYVEEEQAKKLLFEHVNKMRFNPEEVGDVREYMQNIFSAIEPYFNQTNREDPGTVHTVDSEDSTKLQEFFEEVRNRNKGLSGFRFAFRGINRFFKGRLEGNKLCTVGALQHQHKTGFSLALFRHIFQYNIPIVKEWRKQPDLPLPEPEPGEDPIDPAVGWNGRALPYTESEANFYYDEHVLKELPYSMKDGCDPYKGGIPKRIPAILRISTEDEMIDNLEQLYRNLYFNIYKEAPDMKVVTKVEIQEFITKEIKRNGWYVKFLRINPSEWTYRNIIQEVNNLEAKGYDVQVVFVDYLPMIPTRGCEEGPSGHALRDMYRRIRNYMSA